MSDELRRAVQDLQKRLSYLERATRQFVDEATLDTDKGNPVVKFPSKKWRGPDFTGKRFSECSPAFLASHAEWLAWKGTHPKEGKEKFAALDLLDAARARTWARRIARSTKPSPRPLPPPFPPDDDPFGDDDTFGP